ncbi:MAG: ABC transporter ATP-binding protein [Candidatus Woesearchaeota archaeon]
MALQIRDITKSFDDLKVLDHLSLEVGESECISIIGPSGCGKTTLLKIIGGVEEPNKGNIQPKQGMVPIVWQDHRLLPWLNVQRNIEFGLELKRATKPSLVKKYIKLTKLQGFERYYPHQLSEGMKQRVAIARALAVEPEIILLDEPFASLDFMTKLRMYDEIKALQKRLRLSAILVTHDTRDAIIFSNKVAIMTDKPSRIKKVLELGNYNYSKSFFSEKEREIWGYLQ